MAFPALAGADRHSVSGLPFIRTNPVEGVGPRVALPIPAAPSKALPFTNRRSVFPLRSVGQPAGWRADPKVTRHLSSGYPASQSIVGVGRTGYLVHRSLRSVLHAREVFQPTPSPPSSEGGSSSHRLQTPYRDPNWCRLVASRRRTVVLAPSSSHEVLRPYSGRGEVSRPCSAPPERHPSSAFLRPLRV